ncbi:beta strand repeat-containing protein [Planktothrix mougeotii]|uniref:S-layer family protein n=1 Tax=Planktothrix mougeotii LEGE 06226 TaxID=1828728 RepID=A0ABR9UEN7_9CYAN|nr:S-layer family protein [Planktothrix mougeotii]MBE9144286.1 S-layer family protein [Planktothrix mougeotii LEGE 06226]
MKLPLVRLSFFNSSILFYLLYSHPTTAQIIPDATLPINSRVVQQGNTHIIEGGTVAGTNLFHSFESFSIPTNGIGFFNNSTDIQNIFSRVTGHSISNIDGLIQANGIANLFLINPNGLIFGPNAKLDIGGSFFGSTANSIWFADGLEFSATNPQITPLLSINVPLGLQYGTNPGRIMVQGPGHNLNLKNEGTPETELTRDNRPDGLRVNDNQTLALVGGEVRLQGGNLTAEGGRIEVGSVNSNSYITLTHPSWVLGYEMVQNFQDITLLQAASLDVSGAASGNIQVQGRRLTLSEGSLILALKTGSDSAGTLTIKTSEAVEATGVSPRDIASGILAIVSAEGTGIGGNINMETGRLILREGAQIAAGTRGDGQGGTLTVKAAESVEVSGTQRIANFPSGLFTNVQPGVTGDGGDLTIETGRLIVKDGGVVAAGTFSRGDSGNVMIRASESVEVRGFGADSTSVSGIVTQVFFPETTGNGGNLTIETKRLIVEDGAVVAVGTFGVGNAGNLMVRASESIEARGETADGLLFSGLYASSLGEKATGAPGNITIETGRLILQDGGTVTVRSESLEPAGTLNIKADSINLDNLGSINANTQGGGGSIELRSPILTLNNSSITTNATGGDSGGDINLQGELLLLQNNSTLTTNALGSNATGGNINLNLNNGFLVGLENSDITANAEQSRGGQIAINAQGIFGATPRTRSQLQASLKTEEANALDPRQLPTSDITAISQQGGPQLEGIVTVNTPDFDPSSGLVELPVDVLDPTQLIARGCPATRGNSFTVTGRGGLPTLPTQPLQSNNIISVDWVTVNPLDQPENKQNITSQPLDPHPLVEATGWIINDKNQVVLVASKPTTTINNFSPIPESCLTE